MKIILAFLLGIFAFVSAQICTTPNEPRQVLVHPTDCSRYYICIFGREAVYLCPAHINFFNACSMNCTATNDMCFTCADQTTTVGTTTTTVVDGTTTTTSVDVPTPPVDSTTTTEEPTFIPTPPPDTTAGPDTTTTTTTLAGDTTISVPTAPIVPPTPPVVP